MFTHFHTRTLPIVNSLRKVLDLHLNAIIIDPGQYDREGERFRPPGFTGSSFVFGEGNEGYI